MNFLSQKYWPDLEKPDGPVFMTPDAGLAISVFSHDDVEGLFLAMRMSKVTFDEIGACFSHSSSIDQLLDFWA
jgi:hypothetical protein